MQIDYIALGSRIKEARKNKGLTQEQLAELADLSTTHISNIENAKKIPSLQSIVSIANALSATVDALLCDNLDQSRDFYKSEAHEIFDTCTIDEVRLLIDTMKYTLQMHRKHYKQS
ncbi:MAG: helix-turn-helix transcriptional regulator [Lachnospiraceae bacterium]|nr:helix-turn-helix transcriptional regulator [Lachnospiraceae bacterium]